MIIFPSSMSPEDLNEFTSGLKRLGEPLPLVSKIAFFFNPPFTDTVTQSMLNSLWKTLITVCPNLHTASFAAWVTPFPTPCAFYEVDVSVDLSTQYDFDQYDWLLHLTFRNNTPPTFSIPRQLISLHLEGIQEDVSDLLEQVSTSAITSLHLSFAPEYEHELTPPPQQFPNLVWLSYTEASNIMEVMLPRARNLSGLRVGFPTKRTQTMAYCQRLIENIVQYQPKLTSLVFEYCPIWTQNVQFKLVLEHLFDRLVRLNNLTILSRLSTVPDMDDLDTLRNLVAKLPNLNMVFYCFQPIVTRELPTCYERALMSMRDLRLKNQAFYVFMNGRFLYANRRDARNVFAHRLNGLNEPKVPLVPSLLVPFS